MTGCRPKGILRSGQMRDVLIDLHKADGMIQVSPLGRKDSEAKTIYYAQVLQKHGITQAQFDSSIVWYTAHPQLFNKIYPKVMAALREEEEYYTALLAEQGGGKNALTPQQQRDAWMQELSARLKAQYDTTNWEFLEDYYPIVRDSYRIPQDTLMHDSVDQFFPEISVLR